MDNVTQDSFGPLIAYLVPGATVLAGWAPFIPAMNRWASGSPPSGIDGAVVLILMALAVGMTVTAIRWAVVDKIHAQTGLVPPELNFANLPGRVQEFQLLIEIHYRHYQFYANMLIAVAIAYMGYRFSIGWAQPGLIDLGVVVVEPVFFLTSRDTLRKYYSRTTQLLNRPTSES